MGKAEHLGGEGQGAAVPPRRSFVTLPLAQLVPGITRPAFKKRSPAGATLMAEWVAIVGPQLAVVTEPRRLTRGQLTIACSGPVAMELQHLQTTLLDRINTHAGHGLVANLRFIQDHVPAPAAPPPAAGPGAAELAARKTQAAEMVGEMPHGVVSDALCQLWQAMRSRP
jgi:hypothetical protein